MARSPQPRTAANLPDSVLKRLEMYAIAATAAGVGVLASPPVAECKIVYRPMNRVLHRNAPIAFDLNHDGKIDFFLLLRNFVNGSGDATEYLDFCHRPYTINGNWFCTHSTSAPNAL